MPKKSKPNEIQTLYAIEQRDLADPEWKVCTCSFNSVEHSYSGVFRDRETAQKVMKEWLDLKHYGREFMIGWRHQYRIRPIHLLPENGKGFGVGRPRFVGSVEERKKIKAVKVIKAYKVKK